MNGEVRTLHRPTRAPRRDEVPPLHPGDHLTAEEFERRYDAMPELKKAELLDGVVYMPSPVSHSEHGAPHAQFITWLGYYAAYTPGVETGDNSTVRMDKRSRPQSDGMLRILPACGGQSSDSGKYLAGAPELLGEVAATSAAYDLHIKLEVFQRNGVQEYVVWRVWDEAIDWFYLQKRRFVRLPVADGIYKSRVFPGLWLDGEALMRGDMARVFEILQQGLATPEHEKFVRRLARAKAT
jgi:hypothetical protein